MRILLLLLVLVAFYATTAQDQDRDPQAVTDHVNAINKALRNNDGDALKKLIEITRTDPDDNSHDPMKSNEDAIVALRRFNSYEVSVWSAYPIEGSSPRQLQASLKFTKGLRVLFWVMHVEENDSSPSGWTTFYLAPRSGV